MYPGVPNYFAQLVGMAGQQATAQAQYQQQAYGVGMRFANSGTLSPGTVVSVEGTGCDERDDAPIDPFVQLTNHEFHKLLDRFQELI